MEITQQTIKNHAAVLLEIWEAEAEAEASDDEDAEPDLPLNPAIVCWRVGRDYDFKLQSLLSDVDDDEVVYWDLQSGGLGGWAWDNGSQEAPTLEQAIEATKEILSGDELHNAWEEWENSQP